MDYFAKVKKRPPTSAAQLARFHRSWEYIHRVCLVEERKAKIYVQQTDISSTLRQMADLLVDEEAREDENTTGPCMEYFLKNSILQYLVDAAEKEDYPIGLRGEIIQIVASMINCLNDRFLVHNAVHTPIVKLLRFCVLQDDQKGMYTDELVDLMYAICSKIQGYPALLNIFFFDKNWLTTPQKKKHAFPKSSIDEKTEAVNKPHSNGCKEAAAVDDGMLQQCPSLFGTSRPPDYEFLLFTYLLRFAHCEGKTGDYARTGLLFIIEMAKGQLGDFILSSDFTTVLAAGLGALYSQLPRKLIVNGKMDDIYTNVTSYLLSQQFDSNGNNTNNPKSIGAEDSNSFVFRCQLDSFLKTLEFCQDVISRCPNANICRSLLKDVRSVFLENILYPSILECSDLDGSTVAVITYIDLMLQTVEQSELSKMLVELLMDDEQQQLDLSTAMEQIDILEKNSEIRRTSKAHFTLKDLIFSRLKSKAQPTVIATLKLLRTLLRKHCVHANGLISTCPDVNKNQIPISQHLREVELYYSLISTIDNQQASKILSQGYGEYLHDSEFTIENDSCSKSRKRTTGSTYASSDESRPQKQSSINRRSFKYGQRHSTVEQQQQNEKEYTAKLPDKVPIRHRFRPSEPLLQILLNLLAHFFTQSIELNVALTGVISALALCPYRSLEGWISFSETDRISQDDTLRSISDNQIVISQAKRTGSNGVTSINCNSKLPVFTDSDEEDDCSVDYETERKADEKTIPTTFNSYPTFFTVFHTLIQQVNAFYRTEIADFDNLLRERRKALLTGQNYLKNEHGPAFRNKKTTTPLNSLRTGGLNPSSFAASFTKSSFFNHQPFSSTFSSSRITPSINISSLSAQTTSSIRTQGNTQKLPTTPSTVNISTVLNDTVSPLSLHVRKTAHTLIQPLVPSHFSEVNTIGETVETISHFDEVGSTLAVNTTGLDDERRQWPDGNTEISLSMLLNNVVILEEAIKEVLAVLQVRRSSGVDSVLYT
ncbi:Retinoic acid induced 16-like protein-domain-containing protein [Mycotypha africana]|uniref:Retinoic acid induced 16-like protein-domain-containing protein n=1 Tax=Mycotypha africana TaxID=64632 RepID=UPI002301DFB0|nr:Retinoic acid induced 16-like protein-domain-containing protein [Mycotypha africana]KAI8992055.1 Retinoic acid induced 16-like protein-domain-containing protein [Mycotypha africana]